MGKVASYLNEHILGEVSDLRARRLEYAKDAGFQSVLPELVVFPRSTNDIRKIVRFAWQLAEKGHSLPVTIRGLGSGQLGGSIGKGAIIDASKYLSQVIYVGQKDQVIHLRAGTRLDVANAALTFSGLRLANSTQNGTVGGAIASDLLGSKGAFAEAVEKMEVILSNGDLIETGRLSKRDVAKKQGEQTLEGEIYRRIEGLIEDNGDVLAKLDPHDRAGYAGLAKVRGKDGSMDLAPLMVGSEGTLGIISEVVLKAEFYSADQTSMIIALNSETPSRELDEELRKLEPSALELIDGALYTKAIAAGKKYPLFIEEHGSALYVLFDDFNDRSRNHKVHRLKKILKKAGLLYVTTEDVNSEDIEAMRSPELVYAASLNDTEQLSYTFCDAFIPFDRLDVFKRSLASITEKMRLELPIKVNLLTETVSILPVLRNSEAEHQTAKLLDVYNALVLKSDGYLIAAGGEGRVRIASTELSDVYKEVKRIFDPLNILNPDVKTV